MPMRDKRRQIGVPRGEGSDPSHIGPTLVRASVARRSQWGGVWMCVRFPVGVPVFEKPNTGWGPTHIGIGCSRNIGRRLVSPVGH